jgi:hypothetical protein
VISDDTDEKPPVVARRCWGVRNWHRCARVGEWHFFCDEHRWQPFQALAAVFAASVSLASIQASPFYKSLTRPIAERWAAYRTPTASGNRIAIFVARFGDNDISTLTQERVVATLRHEFGPERVEIIPTGITLTLTPNVSDDRSTDDATTAARALLRAKHGDLLIWGQVDAVPGMKPQIEVRFVTSETSTARDEPFSLTDKLMLDAEFLPEMGVALAGVASVLATPVFSNQGQFLVETLTPVADRLQRLARTPPDVMRQHDRAQLLTAYALVQATLGEQAADAARLEEAIAAFRAALEEQTRARVPLEWAMMQNNLGNALTSLGQRETGTARLEEAVAAYRAALEERTRARVPLAWATTESNLGNALTSLGQRETGITRLQEAVAAYRSALEIFNKGSSPYYQSLTNRNLAKASALLSAKRK